MADTPPPNPPPHDRLPIKLILPNQGRERPVPGGGSKKQFRPVNADFRKSLSRQVVAIRQTTTPLMTRARSAPVRVKLLPLASAKSHRPEHLFDQETCPIIGAGALAELFVKATPQGLANLAHRIERNTTKQIANELSCVTSIEPVTPALRRGNATPLNILQRSPKRGSAFITRVSLFDYGADPASSGLIADFEATCKEKGITIRRGGYTASLTYAADCRNVDDVEALSGIVGVRSVREMPLIRLLRPKLLNISDLPPNLPKPEDFENQNAPIVGVVDTGIAQVAPLEGWVAGRMQDVAPPYRNPQHGTFVAGLICWGAQLNPHLPSLDALPCRVFDLEVLPNTDPEAGETTFLTEEELLVSLSSAVAEHANEIKVWNLSLGSNEVCALDRFSPLGEELDKLQERYQITFVISAGNYDVPPLLDYPRNDAQLEAGRITSPADSVLGVTVGSISHIDYPNGGPRQHCPSAFSRHGAGPNHIIKPDHVHYGGTCTTDAMHQSGVRSVTPAGTTAEDLGTSFATPLVSRALAQVFHHITPTPSPVLARALLTHHARDPRTNGRVPDTEENYFGFGLPSVVPICLECTPYTSTLVFDDQLRPGFFLEWDNFPYPPSLQRDGKFYGEIAMTVAFAPARSGRWGSEYCETHIDAHFGVYSERTNRNTGEVTTFFHGLVPPEHRNPGLLHETYQVEKLRKWAPVRTYYANLNPKGEKGSRWRLMLRLLTRHGVEDLEAFKPQPFSLIVTISDPDRRAPVYDEMAQIVRTRFRADNLAVRAAARVRARS